MKDFGKPLPEGRVVGHPAGSEPMCLETMEMALLEGGLAGEAQRAPDAIATVGSDQEIW